MRSLPDARLPSRQVICTGNLERDAVVGSGPSLQPTALSMAPSTGLSSPSSLAGAARKNPRNRRVIGQETGSKPWAVLSIPSSKS